MIVRIQDEIKRYIPDGVDLADELSVDRRAEADNE